MFISNNNLQLSKHKQSDNYIIYELILLISSLPKRPSLNLLFTSTPFRYLFGHLYSTYIPPVFLLHRKQQ